jgi:hypothetical protein
MDPNGTGARVEIIDAEDTQLPRVGGHHILVRCEGRVFRITCVSARRWRISERVGTTEIGHGDLLFADGKYRVVTAAQAGPSHPTWQDALQHHTHAHSDPLGRRDRNPN